jgi:hypothetical protein
VERRSKNLAIPEILRRKKSEVINYEVQIRLPLPATPSQRKWRCSATMNGSITDENDTCA